MRHPKIVNGISVTRVRFHFANATPRDGRKLLALGTFTLNDLFTIAGVRVKQRGDRIVVVMPKRLNPKTNRLRDLAFPITPAGRLMIETAILDAYLEAIATPAPLAEVA